MNPLLKQPFYFLLKYIPLFLVPAALHAQLSSTLKGLVTDSSTRESVSGAAIYDLMDINNGTVSNNKGSYELHLKSGKHAIICSVLGMKTDTFILVVDSLRLLTHNFKLPPLSLPMQTMVISTGKYEQRLQDITVSMDVLKPELIEDKNAANIKVVLEQAPGLNILDGEPQIRGGSGFDFGIGSRVAILIDGIPALPGDGGRIDWNFYPLEDVEQIEIIKGASSVTNGSSALSGSINVRTAFPADVPSTTASVYSGLYDSPPIAGSKWWTGNANFSGTSFLHKQKIGRLDLVLGGMAIYDHGYIGPPQYEPGLGKLLNGTTINPDAMAEKTGRLNFGLRYHPKNIPHLYFGINGNFVESTNALALIWSNDSSGLYRAYPSTVILQDQKIFYLDPFINYFAENGFEHSLRARYYYADNIVTYNPSTLTNVSYAEYQCIKNFYELGRLNVTAGLLYNHTYSHADSLDYLNIINPATTNTLQNYAIYAQLDKKFWKVLNLSAGFRVENFKVDGEKSVSQPIFRSGANLQLAKGTFLHSSFGQGYRFPTLTEQYLTSQLSSLSIFANPELKPETSWNTEIGIKQGFKIDDFIGFLDATAFWQEFQNTIEITYGAWRSKVNEYGSFSDTTYSTGFKYLNTGPTRVKGVDLSLAGEGKISRNFRIDILAGYTYIIPQALNPDLIYSVDTAHNKLSYKSTSSDSANNILKYRFQTIAKADLQITYKKYSIGGDWLYYSYMQNIDEVFYSLATLASYGIKQYRETHGKGINVFNARAGYEISKKMKAECVVNNMFNLSYSLRPLKIEAPRTFALRLTLKV